ncbi:hypothetical protein [Citrobacter koseri]|uniref:hypothetical protein n=1 Tax=Citrobacter koseri TaxID=545 RepID=UPI0038910A18
MAKPDWGELQKRFLSDNAKTGVSPKDWCEARGLNYASARRYIKKTAAQNAQETAQKKVRSAQSKKTIKPRPVTSEEENCAEGESANSPDAKRNRRSGNPAPTPKFQPGNQQALKHGGYGRRMLLSDAVTEDALSLTLDDELFWLRAASLTAAENIGRWRLRLEEGPEGEERKVLMDNISAAEKAMHRNTARIESLEFTKAAVSKAQAQDEKLRFELSRGKQLLNPEARKAAADAERSEQEAELKRKGGNGGEKPTIVIKLVNSPDDD